MNGEAGAKEATDAELARVFDFTAGELSQNRALELADGQTTVLWQALALALPLALFGVVAGLVMLKYGRGRYRVLVPALAIPAGLIVGWIVAYPSLIDLFNPRVAVVEAPIDEISIVGKGRGHAVLHVGGLRILTRADTEAARRVIALGRVHRVHYLPRTLRLLSLESR
jgi:hypothetical protein